MPVQQKLLSRKNPGRRQPAPLFLPMSGREMEGLGWDCLDILLVSGDAYVDHPSFGVALLGRWLAAHGFRTGIVAQPRWSGEGALADLRVMGRPRLFAGVTAGALDSMLAHYTAFRKKRHDDAYTPGGLAGARPNRAATVYTGLVRQTFPDLPVVLGGIEASMRRISHYDFWSDSLRRPLLQDSKADLLVYGMGELALLEIAKAAKALAARGAGPGRADLRAACRDIPGLAWMASAAETRCLLEGSAQKPEPAVAEPEDVARAGAGARDQAVLLPAHEEIAAAPALLMKATLALERQIHLGDSRAVQFSGDRAVVLNRPARLLCEAELDELYSLPYTRLAHPSYEKPIPAWEMIRTSITSHRGCAGGCSFCSLALHQGRRIASRSKESILREAALISGCSPAGDCSGTRPGGEKPPRWAGSISDVGGPSANMWRAACALPAKENCRRASCLHPAVCPFFKVDQKEGVALLREIAALPGIRHVRVASGVRFDLALLDDAALKAYTHEFTGGQLKVAPEHSEDELLKLMRKPGLKVFENFLAAFVRLCQSSGKELYAVPYLMSAFPGCTEEHMRNLAGWLKRRNWSPRQIQCFIPSPGTVATAMFHAGTNPDGKPLHVARSDKERLRQHYLLLGGPARF